MDEFRGAASVPPGREALPCVPEPPDDRFIGVEDAALLIEHKEKFINRVKKCLKIMPGLFNLFFGFHAIGDIFQGFNGSDNGSLIVPDGAPVKCSQTP